MHHPINQNHQDTQKTYAQALVVFLKGLSAIESIWLMLLIIWHISIWCLLASNLAILMSGHYVTGIVEEQITSQQICGRHKDRTCTDYDAMIHYTFDGRGHAFKSDAIGQAAIGSKFWVIVVPGDPHKASTVIGTILASIGMLWQVCIWLPLYTIIYQKIRWYTWSSIEQKSYKRWMPTWAITMATSLWITASVFFYFQGDLWVVLIMAILVIFVVISLMTQTKQNKKLA